MVDIGKFMGWVITYEGSHTGFQATKDKIKLKADTEVQLQELIKKQERTARRFQTIDAIEKGKDRVGRITSVTAESDIEVYFSFKDEERPDLKATRTKKCIKDRWGYSEKPNYYFVVATKKNLAILKRIKHHAKKIEQLRDEQKRLRVAYEQDVTKEMIDERRGVK